MSNEDDNIASGFWGLMAAVAIITLFALALILDAILHLTGVIG